MKVAYCFYITLGECSATRRVCVELFRHTYDRLLCGHIWTWWWTTSSVFAAGSCAIKHLRAVPLSCPLRFVVQERSPAGACIMLCCDVGCHACSFGQFSLDSLCVSVLCIACLLCDYTCNNVLRCQYNHKASTLLFLLPHIILLVLTFTPDQVSYTPITTFSHPHPTKHHAHMHIHASTCTQTVSQHQFVRWCWVR